MRVAKQVSITTLFAMIVGGTGTRRCRYGQETLDGGATSASSLVPLLFARPGLQISDKPLIARGLVRHRFSKFSHDFKGQAQPTNLVATKGNSPRKMAATHLQHSAVSH